MQNTEYSFCVQKQKAKQNRQQNIHKIKIEKQTRLIIKQKQHTQKQKQAHK